MHNTATFRPTYTPVLHVDVEESRASIYEGLLARPIMPKVSNPQTTVFSDRIDAPNHNAKMSKSKAVVQLFFHHMLVLMIPNARVPKRGPQSFQAVSMLPTRNAKNSSKSRVVVLSRHADARESARPESLKPKPQSLQAVSMLLDP